MGYSGIQGIPMIATSPVRHDSPLNFHGLEVTSYQPPWKALSDFALHADLDNNGSRNHTPAIQHLFNQASHHHCWKSFQRKKSGENNHRSWNSAFSLLHFVPSNISFLFWFFYVFTQYWMRKIIYVLVFLDSLFKLRFLFLTALFFSIWFLLCLNTKNNLKYKMAMLGARIFLESLWRHFETEIIFSTDARLWYELGAKYSSRTSATFNYSTYYRAWLAITTRQHRFLRYLPRKWWQHARISIVKIIK